MNAISESSYDVPRNVLLQASTDVVVSERGGIHFVDFNRFQEGYSLQLLNSGPAVEAAFARETEGIMKGKKVHLVGSTSWPELNYGEIYGLTIKYLLKDVAGASDVSITYGLGGLDVRKGRFTVTGEERAIFYYRDFEAKSNRQKLDSDLKKLFSLIRRAPDFEASLEQGWVNWPTACWCPANMSIDALMTKSEIYRNAGSAGFDVPTYVLINDRQHDAELREVLHSMLKEHGIVIVKPDKVGGRAVGVSVIHDSKDIEGFIGSFRQLKLENWLVEGHIPREVLVIDGKRIIYDLIPLVVGAEAVGTYAKYSIVENGVAKKMPGQNPAVFMFPGLENQEHLTDRAMSLMDKVGFKGGGSAAHDRNERMRQFGAVEGPEAEGLRDYFRNGKGKDTIRKAEAAAVHVKRMLMEMARDKVPALKDSLGSHIAAQKLRQKA
ncbi:MAG: hypothetical protein KGH74_00820 [Candidatus Micrarchaeota archaeon]|nr:hypothetical protein [Candidatus Micrarchaeota archaeon]